MSDVVRFGVSLPGKLVKKFDETIRGMGYFNRSKAVGDALTGFIVDKAWQEGGTRIATISFQYDHGVRGVNHKLVEIQHHFDCVISTMHAHVSHDDCVEVLIARGEAKQIKKLAGEISAINGIKNCKTVVLS